MMRNIVICMDGTWDDPLEKTNVYQLFRLLPGNEAFIEEKGPIRSHCVKETENLTALYFEGVGANGRSRTILGGAFGVGLHDRVIDAFVLVSQSYKVGDKIWIFGFSRGSWAARSLAGMIGSVGLIGDPTSEDAAERAETLWLAFKSRRAGSHGESYWGDRDEKPIRLVGVWDTVGALGIPLFNGIRAVDRLEQQTFDFADLDLSSRVELGFQALAIDETRFDFTPALWNSREGVVQVWFAGVHSDVGGGYPESGLSDVALEWMVDRVNAVVGGIHLKISDLGNNFQPDPFQDRHDEAKKEIWQLRPRKPRTIPVIALLDASVQSRLGRRNDYRPESLRAVTACAQYYYETNTALVGEKLLPPDEVAPCHLEVGESCSLIIFADKWWNTAWLRLRVGERYEVEARGKWTDRENETDSAGYPSSSPILKLLEGSRRVPTTNWFALIAAIHPDPGLEARNPDSDNFLTGEVESLRKGVAKVDAESQLAVTSNGGPIESGTDGCLYFFANDSPFAYSNNSGFLELRVRRVA